MSTEPPLYAHVDVSAMARGLSLYLPTYFVYASSEGSGKYTESPAYHSLLDNAISTNV